MGNTHTGAKMNSGNCSTDEKPRSLQFNSDFVSDFSKQKQTDNQQTRKETNKQIKSSKLFPMNRLGNVVYNLIV